MKRLKHSHFLETRISGTFTNYCGGDSLMVKSRISDRKAVVVFALHIYPPVAGQRRTLTAVGRSAHFLLQ